MVGILVYFNWVEDEGLGLCAYWDGVCSMCVCLGVSVSAWPKVIGLFLNAPYIF